MSPRRSVAVLTTAGLLAFALFLLIKAPASAVHVLAMESVQMSDYRGTLWRGGASLSARGVPIGVVAWRLSAFQFLAGRLTLDIALEGHHAAMSGRLVHSYLRDRSEVSEIQGDIALALLALVTRIEQTVGANIQLQGVALTVQNGRIVAASGHARLGAVTALKPQRQYLGEYVLALQMVGDNPGVELTEWSGPLAVTGRAWIEPAGSWFLDLRLRADAADPNLRSVLFLVGEPEADGWTPLVLRVTR